MRIETLALVALFAFAPASAAQKKPEKPKLHADFYFGTYPASREAAAMMSKEAARLILVGFHQGWDIEKIAKEGKQQEEDLDNLFADLEEARLVSELDQYSASPLLPVIRDKDIEKAQKDIETHTQDLVRLIRSLLPEIETTASSFSGSKGIPKQQLLYQILVGSILFGGMNDILFEDQTMMVNPPRRAGGLRYYAWLVESDPVLAGTLKRDQWDSGGYTLISIGSSLPEERTTLEKLRAANGMILEEAEARRFRSFISVFTRDKLLPYFKKNRAEYLKVLNLLEAGKYVRVSDAFAWFYDQMANGVVADLTKAGLIEPPATQYLFALKAPGR
jgi:hypothetical protein